jgi:pyrroline-5-carboxylate reductase
MFNAVGRTVVVDEKNMDAVTGLSASGPAFAYIILESRKQASKWGSRAMWRRC